VWSVRTVDEATERLMGIAAGERAADGTYPDGSLHRRVEARLERFAEQARRIGIPEPGGIPGATTGGPPGGTDTVAPGPSQVRP